MLQTLQAIRILIRIWDLLQRYSRRQDNRNSEVQFRIQFRSIHLIIIKRIKRIGRQTLKVEYQLPDRLFRQNLEILVLEWSQHSAVVV